MVLAGILYAAPDCRRTLSLADRTFACHKSVTGPYRLFDDGHVVGFELPRQHHVRLCRPDLRETVAERDRILLVLDGAWNRDSLLDVGICEATQEGNGLPQIKKKLRELT